MSPQKMQFMQPTLPETAWQSSAGSGLVGKAVKAHAFTKSGWNCHVSGMR
ncbi:hypothetical protein [Streptomyces sp. NPDC046939]